MKPETSTKLKPINDHLINTFEIEGFRHIENINILNTKPTPIATPTNDINGILLAKYLNPSKIIYLLIITFDWYNLN